MEGTILRAENQDLAKKDVVLSVQDDTVFILMVWAMKFTHKCDIERNNRSGLESAV